LDFPGTDQLPIVSPLFFVQREETQKKKRKLEECQETRAFKNAKIDTSNDLATVAQVKELEAKVIGALNIICPIIIENRLNINRAEIQMDSIQRFGNWPSPAFSPLPVEDFSDPFFPAPAPVEYAADDDWTLDIEELGTAP